MINKMILVILAVLCLSACGHRDITYVPTPVKCPSPKPLPEPQYWPITKDASDAYYVKAMLVNYKLCRADNKMLRMVLEGYRHE